jgi:hypothetical protein
MGQLQARLSQLIAEQPPNEGERVWLVSSAREDPSSLAAIVDAARGVGLPVDGFIDPGAVTAAALGIERNALVVEIGLHHVAVIAVERGGQARRRRAIFSDRGGLLELQEAWLNLISAAMVKRTRFDPLHDASTEAQLHAALPQWIRELSTAASVTASTTSGNERFDVELSRDQFSAAAQPVYREIVRLLHELRPAGAPVTLIVPEAVSTLPAMQDVLKVFLGCELITLREGFAAAATSLLELPQSDSDTSVRLLRKLPLRAQPALENLAHREYIGGERMTRPAASHVLFEGRAHALSGALVVGRAPDGASAIVLPEGLAGVSRRHCTFLSEGGELVIIDHSRFGTFLNGERVSERARAHAGDKVRIGEPGVELSLIALS